MFPVRLAIGILLASLCTIVPNGRASDCSCDKVTISSLKLVSYEVCGSQGADSALHVVAGRSYLAEEPLSGEDAQDRQPEDGVMYTSPEGFKLEVENSMEFVVQMARETTTEFGSHKFRMGFGCGVEKVTVAGNILSVKDKEADTAGGYTLRRKGCGVELESPDISAPPAMITIIPSKPKDATCPGHDGAAPPTGSSASPDIPDLQAGYSMGTDTNVLSPGLLGWSADTATEAVSLDSLSIPGVAPAGSGYDDFVQSGTGLFLQKINSSGTKRLQYHSKTTLLDATSDGTTLDLKFFSLSGTPTRTVDWNGDTVVDFHNTASLTPFKRVQYVKNGGEVTVKVGATSPLDTLKLNFIEYLDNGTEVIWTDLQTQKSISVRRAPASNNRKIVVVEERHGATLVSSVGRVFEVHPTKPFRFRLQSITRHSGDTNVPSIMEEFAYDSSDPDFVKSRTSSDGTWTHYRKEIPPPLEQLDLQPEPTGQYRFDTLATIRPWLGAAAPVDGVIVPAQSVIDIRREYRSSISSQSTVISETITAGTLSARTMTVKLMEDGYEKTITHTWANAGTSTTNQRWTYASGTWQGRIYRSIDEADNTLTYSYDASGASTVTTATAGTIANPNGIANKTTRTITTEDADGYTVSETLQICTGSGFEAASTTTYTYERNEDGRLLSTTTIRDGREVSKSGCTGGTRTTWGEDGSKTTSTSDDDGYPVSSVEHGHGVIPTVTTTYSRDGLTTTVTRSAPGTPPIVTSSTRNALGDQVSSTDAAGTVTTRAITRAQDLSTTTETNVTNGLTRWTTRHRDGRFKESGGTGVIATRATYEVDSSGFLVTTESSGPATSGHSPRWSRVTTDWAGRVVERVAPAPPDGIDSSTRYPDVVAAYTYDENGRQTMVSDNSGRAPSRTVYHDSLGSEISSGTDFDGVGSFTAGVDRYTTTDRSYVKEAGFWWEITTSTTPTGDGTALITTRKTKLKQAAGSESETTDAAGTKTTTTVVFDLEAHTTTTTTTSPDGTVTNVQVNGVLVSSTSPGATRAAEYAYDGLHRLIRQTDVRGAVTWFSYDTAGRMISSTNHEGQVTRRTYYPADHQNAGLPWQTIHSGGAVTESSYDALGRVIAVSGTADYPQAYTYDDFGNLHTLVTSGSQTATTTWQIDPATGLVLAKQTQDGKQVKYAYDAAGAVVKRQWARGITTTVARNAASGDVTGISHDDNATFSVAYGNHDVFGRPGMITETRNGVASTSSLTYTASSGAVSATYAEDHPFLPKVALSVIDDDSRGRSTGHAVTLDGNIIHSWTHGYDSLGRLGSVTGHGMTATLDYYPGTGMLQSQTITKADTTKVLKRDHNIDLLGRTYGVVNRGGPANTLIASVGHTYDTANRRATARREDGAKWTYGYNTRSEVTAAAKSLEDATSIPGLEFGYNYDGMGNRLAASKGNPAITTAYTPDAMNRYGTITTPGADDILVRSGVPVGIAADGQAGTVTTAGSLHNGRVDVDNAPNGAWADITVTATGFSDTGHRWVPPATVEPTYDDDGNLLDDGRWTYTWDAMNRLVAMAPTANALTAGVPNEAITFAYDFASRRIGKKVTTTSGTGTTVKDTRYLYDGWNVVAEFEYDDLGDMIPQATYVWSMDLSGTLQGAGGVGGLLSVNLLSPVSAASAFLPCYDANGNIIAWTDGNGSPAQRQDYDPFGNLVIVERLAITPADCSRLTYGFSTKPLDAETGLHYYGYRFYDTRNGRWINRDPIEENGGLNLYGFIENKGSNVIDVLGNDTLLLIVGEEYINNTNVFSRSADYYASLYKNGGKYNPHCDAVVKLELSGKGGRAVDLVIRSMAEIKALRYVYYIGHGGPCNLFLTGAVEPGANIGFIDVNINNRTDDDPAQFFATSLYSLPKFNLTKHAQLGMLSCHTGMYLAPALAEHFDRPVQAAKGSVNYKDDGQAFVRLHRVLISGGFKYYGQPSDFNAPRDECWSEEMARKAGY